MSETSLIGLAVSIGVCVLSFVLWQIMWKGKSRKGGLISVVGPEGSGKTTLIEAIGGIARGEREYTVRYGNNVFDVTDGMLDPKCDGVVFVLNAAGTRKELEATVAEWKDMSAAVEGKPTVIIANMTDVAGSQAYFEIASRLGVDDLVLFSDEVDTVWRIKLQMASVKAKFGYVEGLKWLVGNLKN